MSRLIDRLLRVLGNSPLALALTQKSIEVIDGTNVAQYMYSGVAKGWDIVKDVPNIAPPFPRMWIECRAPNIIKQPDGSQASWPHGIEPSAWGAYLQAEELDKLQVQPDEPRYVPGSDAENAKWLLTILMYTEKVGETPCGPVFSWWIPVTADGKFVMRTKPDGSLFPYFKTSMLDPDASAELIRQTELSYLLNLVSILLTVSFMHCKNVKQVVTEPLAKAKKESKKTYGRELVNYKVLHIEPMKKILVKEGNASTHGLQHALSICRGHFKTFETKGLFGKYTGTYWWNAHVRGQPEFGTIYNDYAVSAPQRKDAQDGEDLKTETATTAEEIPDCS